MYTDDGVHPKTQVSSSMTGRRAARLGRILLLWALVSLPAAYLIYALVEPTYEAVSLLRAEPWTPDIYSGPLHGTPDMGEVRPYLLTQIQLIKSNMVLDAAIARSEIRRLPMIRSAQDPKAELRREIQAEIVGDNTYLIQVALNSRDPVEAASIVNAVVEEYLDQHGRYQRIANSVLKKNFQAERDKLERQIKDTRAKLAELATGQDSHSVIPRLDRDGKDRDGAIDPSLAAVTAQQFVDMTSWLLKADFELMDAQAQLEVERLPASQTSAEKIRELEAHLEAIRRKRDHYKRYLAHVKIERRSSNVDSIEASLLTQDLQHLRQLQDVVKSKLAQIEFELGQELYRITVQDKADVPKAPSENRRFKLMTLGPLGALAVVLGMFFLREIWPRRARGTDADV